MASSGSCGFPDPTGLTQEVYTAARTAPMPLDIPGSGFVTGAGGLGHVALTTKKPQPGARLLQPRLRCAAV